MRMIALLCILSTSIGVMALVVVLSVMKGFNNNIQDKLLAVEPHVVIPMSIKEQTQWKSSFSNKFKEVESFNSYEHQDVILKTSDGLFGGAMAYGLEQDRLFNIFHQIKKRLVAKKKHSYLAVERRNFELAPGEVIVGVDLARSLQIFEGDEIVLMPPEALLLPKGQAPPYAKLKVKTLLSADLPEIDGKYVYYNLSHTMTSLRASKSLETGIELRLLDPQNWKPLVAQFKKQYPEIQSWVDRNSSLFFALRMERIVMSVFLGLSALITSFSIVAVLVLLVTQKRRDIGIFMAMGMSTSEVRKMFTKIGLILSSLGLGGGLIVGTVVALVMDYYPLDVLPDIYYESTIPAQLDPRVLLVVAIGSTLLGLLGSSIPVWLYARVSPVDALKGELHR